MQPVGQVIPSNIVEGHCAPWYKSLFIQMYVLTLSKNTFQISEQIDNAYTMPL